MQWRWRVRVCLMLLTFGWAAVGLGQSRAETDEAFDVVSIRPGAGSGELDFGVTADGYRARNAPLYWVVMEAFYPRSASYWKKDRLRGAPGWVSSEPFDVDARVSTATAAEFAHLTEAERMRRVAPMLRKMLAERCGLVVRQAEAELTLYTLTVGSHGAKLRLARPDDAVGKGIDIGDAGVMAPVSLPGAGHGFRFSNTSMAVLAEVLSGLTTESEPAVEDRTGLPGKYDFVLEKREAEGGVPEPASLWRVEDLGLELKRAKGEGTVLWVEHVERPTAN